VSPPAIRSTGGEPPARPRMLVLRAGRCFAAMRMRRRSELTRTAAAARMAAASASGEERLRICTASYSNAEPIAQIMTVPAA
jgi:hypothetical protein